MTWWKQVLEQIGLSSPIFIFCRREIRLRTVIAAVWSKVRALLLGLNKCQKGKWIFLQFWRRVVGWTINNKNLKSVRSTPRGLLWGIEQMPKSKMSSFSIFGEGIVGWTMNSKGLESAWSRRRTLLLAMANAKKENEYFLNFEKVLQAEPYRAKIRNPFDQSLVLYRWKWTNAKEENECFVNFGEGL